MGGFPSEGPRTPLLLAGLLVEDDLRAPSCYELLWGAPLIFFGGSRTSHALRAEVAAAF